MFSFIISKKPKHIALSLLAIAWLLIIFSTILGLLIASIGKEESSMFLRNAFNIIDLDRENNISSFYGGTLWLIASLTSLYTSNYIRKDNKQFYFWRFLSFIFFFFAVDEWVAIHEYVGDLFAEILTSLEFGTFTWLIPGAFFILAFVLFFLYFLKSLPPTYARLILFGFLVFVLGAMGVEVLGGFAYQYYDGSSIIFRMLVQLEEMLEMMGVIIIIFAIISYLHAILNYQDSSKTKNNS